MLHLLVVDDEPYAVDYLVEALDEVPDLQLTITKAYSGREALVKADKGRVDLLLTDIRMPGMNGMELADEILGKWPRCRVIFLTGYNDFEYVQSALRKGGVDYVLKTEGDRAIINAIEKAMQEIRTEISEEQVLLRAREQLFMALPSLRRDYLLQLMEGETDSPSMMEKRFEELGIDLDPNHPVLAVLGRVDDWGKFSAPADRTLLFFSIINIAEEFFTPDVRFLSFLYDRTRIVWLMQPKEGSMENLGRLLDGCAEQIQMFCKRLLKIPLSIAIPSAPSSWELVGSRVEALKLQLTFRMGTGDEMLITEPTGEERRRSSCLFLEMEQLRSRLNRFDLLENYLDNGGKEEFVTLFRELFTVEVPLFSDGEGRWFGLELFSRLSAFFLSYMNKRRLLEELDSISIQAEKMLSPDEHADWNEMIDYYCKLGAVIADYNGQKQVERTHDMIAKVHDYIHQFLHEELSLTRLAELVYLSPPYFSRLYKQMTGQGLLEYINETRIAKAKLLLKTTDRKIHEIASQVGLESAPYFTRLFRKRTGFTPQEYRDSNKSWKGSFTGELHNSGLDAQRIDNMNKPTP